MSEFKPIDHLSDDAPVKSRMILGRHLKTRMGPTGIHLFDRRSGMNILLDEIEIGEELWSPAPRYVSVALTNACELSCPFCYAPKKPAALDFERLKGWLTELDKNGCLGIGFGGGEPTLYRDFAAVCQFASEHTDLAVTFTTHGHNLDEHMLEKLKGNVHFVRISMDGIGATYEGLRGRSFNSFLERLKALRSISSFGVNYVVNRRTIADLDSAVEIVADMGAGSLLLLPEQSVGNLGGIDDETYRQLKEWLSGYQGKVALSISEAGADRLNFEDPLPREASLREYAHIDAWGTLKKSSYSTRGQSIGVHGIMRTLSILEDT